MVTIPSPLFISRMLLLIGIQISNIGSIKILWPVYLKYITEAFLVLSAVLGLLALFVVPAVICCGGISEMGNTRYLIIFGAVCLLNFPSCVTLPFRAFQNHATALCQDLSESGDCTLAHFLIGFHYTSVIFAIIGFVITYIDRRAGCAPKVSPQYSNAQVANSPFTTFQYPQGVEFKNVKVFRNARQAYGERSTGNPV
ncbi:hypothetical protein P692DRAFT_20835068 [Suillus brevipes Sb2]|nr:hypothetical protein P692DRAFT_20835068 [Suillus brevipes Sb2]